jgi:hypothetical protein
MLDTPRTWRYQSAVLLGPRPKLPDQPNSGPEEGWGAPFELPRNGAAREGAKRGAAVENVEPFNSGSPENSSSPDLLMQAQGSQQVSLRASRPTPGSAGSVRGFAGVAQLVEHLFCKQVVSGSIPLASSGARRAMTQQNSQIVRPSEGCPSGQREQAVNLPARAYVGSNPTPSTTTLHSVSGGGVGLFALGSAAPPRWSESSRVFCRRGSAPPQAVLGAPPQVLVPRPQNGRRGMLRRGSGFHLATNSAGVAQLVERQPSKLNVEGSSPFSRSSDENLSRRFFSNVSALPSSKQARPASLVAGEAEASTGAERTLVREHRSAGEAQPAAKIAGRRFGRNHVNSAHLAQMVEHVLGKDEVTSSILVVGSNSVQLQ